MICQRGYTKSPSSNGGQLRKGISFVLNYFSSKVVKGTVCFVDKYMNIIGKNFVFDFKQKSCIKREVLFTMNLISTKFWVVVGLFTNYKPLNKSFAKIVLAGKQLRMHFEFKEFFESNLIYGLYDVLYIFLL